MTSIAFSLARCPCMRSSMTGYRCLASRGGPLIQCKAFSSNFHLHSSGRAFDVLLISVGKCCGGSVSVMMSADRSKVGLCVGHELGFIWEV